MVKKVCNLSEFESEIKGPGLVVVDFYTEWCGPCKKIAPFIENLAVKYPEVKFIKVNIEECSEIAGPRRITSIPTFHFILNGSLVDEMKGADPVSLEQKVVQHKVDTNPFAKAGYKLSSAADANQVALSAREARLKAFGSVEGPHRSNSSAGYVQSKQQSSMNNDNEVLSALDVDEDEALSKALALSMQGAPLQGNSKETSQKDQRDAADYAAAAAELDAEQNGIAPEHFMAAPGQKDDAWEEEMVPVPVNEELLQQLLDMGFPDVRARKSLVHGGNLDGAMTWISEHQDDADIDQPYMVKKSDTIPRPPLTEEEKAKRVLAIKEKVKERQAERSKQEKVDEIRKEKERRERGQQIDQTLEERQRLQRKRDAEKMKKEKDDANKERLRLRAEIARDKEVRKANKGVLPSVLGVDGYNPSIIQYDVPSSSSSTAAASSNTATTTSSKSSAVNGSEDNNKDSGSCSSNSPTTIAGVSTSSLDASRKPPAKKVTTTTMRAATSATTPAVSPADAIDNAIQTIMRYKSGGDGGQALKLLLTLVKNVAENPSELKYRSINMEGNAFKSKLSHLVGPLQLLRALGFQKAADDEEGKLKLLDLDASQHQLFSETAVKLSQAEAMYKQLNP